MINYVQLANEAYIVYGQSVDNKNYQGLPMPTWENLPDSIKRAWIATAEYLYNEGARATKKPPTDAGDKVNI